MEISLIDGMQVLGGLSALSGAGWGILSLFTPGHSSRMIARVFVGGVIFVVGTLVCIIGLAIE